MNPKLGRRFATREELTGFVRRLSERGIELDVPGDVAPPTGTPLDLDLRLEDDSHLIVGTGEVTEGGRAGSAFRVRFLELSRESRAGLDELMVLVAAREDVAPRPSRSPAGRAGSIVDLVEETYGQEQNPAALESSSILVPPEPGAGSAGASGPAPGPAPSKAPASDAGTEGAGPPAKRGERSLLRRLGLSPAVIVVAVIAGATGAAVDAWFQDLATFVGHLTGGAGGDGTSTTMDIPPADVTPSDFSAEPAAAGEGTADTAATGDPDARAGGAPGAPDGGASPGTEPAASAEGLPVPVEVEAETAGLDGAEEGRPADRVRLITWDEGPSETVVTFWGNGRFPPQRVERVRVAGGQPRELIKLRGIDLPYRETVIQPGTPELQRIRTGFHPRQPVNELHVVLDLAGPDVQLDRVVTGERTLRFHLRSTPESAAAPPDENA